MYRIWYKMSGCKIRIDQHSIRKEGVRNRECKALHTEWGARKRKCTPDPIQTLTCDPHRIRQLPIAAVICKHKSQQRKTSTTYFCHALQYMSSVKSWLCTNPVQVQCWWRPGWRCASDGMRPDPFPPPHLTTLCPGQLPLLPQQPHVPFPALSTSDLR